MKRLTLLGHRGSTCLIRNAAAAVLAALFLAGAPQARADWTPGEPYKWLQMPDETPNGIDVEMTAPYRLADDFLCTNTGAITDLHLWLSWKHDQKPPDAALIFNISFWSDQPTNANNPFSHPLELLWQTNLVSPNFTSRLWKQVMPGEGWMTPPQEWQPLADQNIWQYNFFFDPTNTFFQEGTPQNPLVYWVSVSVMVLEPGYFIGWKTTTNHWNDDAVWNYQGGPWNELRYPPGHPYAPESIDLAFVLTSKVLDFGDAPDGINPPGYPTLLFNNGARHTITPTGPWLGPLADNPDDEPDGQPNPRATGDDNDISPLNPGPNYDDENGVIIPMLIVGQTATIQITVSDPTGLGGFVEGWIDFNTNRIWEVSEQVVAAFVAPGITNIPVPVPASVTATNSYARFRINSLGLLLNPAGPAPDGEVEDYEVQITQEQELLDFGDAPDTLQIPGYPTLLANNGARHLIGPGPWLGSASDNPDDEPDGQPNAAATGDDLDIAPGNPGPNKDDENGVTFLTPLVPGFNATVQVVATGNGILNGWLDFGSDRSWAQPVDYIFPNLPLGPGTNLLYFTVPAGAVITTNTYARFRYTSAPLPGPASYAGLARDGEVEDYVVAIVKGFDPLPDFDFGDAPEPPYPTLLPSGARHVGFLGFCLGQFIDTEPNGQPDPLALMDDAAGVPDDEDGVTFTTLLRRGSNACVDVVLTSLISFGRLDAWVDFDRSGIWGDSAGENIFSSLPVFPGTNTGLCFAVPLSSRVGNTYARFRLSSLGGLSPAGLAANGEVEDYLVNVCQNPPVTNVVVTNINVATYGGYQVVTLGWNAEANVIYQAEQAPGLTNAPSWSDVGPEIIGPASSILLTNTTIFEKYYRIKVPGVCP